MKTEDLLLLFRKQVQDLAKPYLWDDVEVFQYLVSAQDDLVRVIGGISDSTTRAICDVSVVPNAPFAKISPYILHITKARLVDANRNIPIVGEADISQRPIVDYGFQIQQSLDDNDTGRVDYAVIGINDNKLRWLKVPETADTFRMHVYRLPYPRMVDSNSCLEVDEQHHIHLLMGMKALAYRKEDAETYDKTLAAENESGFREYCERARDEKQRQRHKPRTVQFSW